MSDLSIASLTRHMAEATAPGGILTRKSTVVGAAGALAGLVIVGSVILSALRGEPDPAAMRVRDPGIARLETRSYVFTDARIGRREIRQYGALDHGNMDSTLVMTMPPRGQSTTRDFEQEVGELDPLRNTNITPTGVFDLATRFGSYRAIEFSIDLNGRWKQCFAFLSRFESAAIYLKGWACDAVGSRMNADRVACLLDGMTFASVASDEAQAFLQQRAGRQSICAARRLPSMERWRPRRP